MRENAFRRYRLGQWVGVDDAWLPDGAWADCTDATRTIPDGTEVVLAFDGSFNGDTTVRIVATVDQRPHVDLVELWEAAGVQVPIVDVEQAIRQACRRWRVLEIAADRSAGPAASSSWTARGCQSWSTHNPPAG